MLRRTGIFSTHHTFAILHASFYLLASDIALKATKLPNHLKPGPSRIILRSRSNMAITLDRSGQADTMQELASNLHSFGLNDVPAFPGANPALNPVDIYRAHLCELIAPIVGADPKVVYPAIQWTQTLEKGDVTLPVPALRLKGKKPDETAKLIAEKVGSMTW